MEVHVCEYVSVCVNLYLHTCLPHVENKGQKTCMIQFASPYGFQESDSSPHGQQQVPLHTEPSAQLSNLHLTPQIRYCIQDNNPQNILYLRILSLAIIFNPLNIYKLQLCAIVLTWMFFLCVYVSLSLSLCFYLCLSVSVSLFLHSLSISPFFSFPLVHSLYLSVFVMHSG